MTDEKETTDTNRDRTVLQTLFLRVLQSVHESQSGLEELHDSTEQALERYLTPIKATFIMVSSLVAASQSAAAQESGTDICGEGFGLMIFDMQMMAWQILLGALFIIFMLGLVLRAVPMFTGSTAVGSLMMIGPIVGVIAFIFFIQFIDIALGYAGGPGVGEGCSPFV